MTEIFTVEHNKIITLNDDLTFRFQNPEPSEIETNYDKRGTYTKTILSENVYLISFNFKEQYEDGIYKPYEKLLKVEIIIDKNRQVITLVKWRLGDQDVANPVEGTEFSYTLNTIF
jgi:hypothetical protein